MISLYRGELHKVSDVPRQWTVPKSQIPVSVFRSALKKRNAALDKLLQSPLQTTDTNYNPVANGTSEPCAEPSGLDGSGELGKRGGPENDVDKEGDGMGEHGDGLLDGKRAESQEQTELVEEDSERRQERKRKREEDTREESGSCIERKGNSAETEGGEMEAKLRSKFKVLSGEWQPMIVDSIDQRVAMDCDVQAEEKTMIDCDESMDDLVRVRVSETGTSSGMESKQGSESRLRDETDAKHVGNLRSNGEVGQLEASGRAMSNFEEMKSAQIVPATTENDRDTKEAADLRRTEERERKRKELEAKLEKLRGEKHRFVLRLKQVLHEEELKKRGSLVSGSPASLPGAAAGPYDSSITSIHGEKQLVGGSHTSTDLEDGELEYARTPSPPIRAISSVQSSLSSHNSLCSTPPLIPVIGRQTSLSQHLPQCATGRGGYYVPGLGIPPSPVAPGIAGGALSPGMGFMGNLQSPLGSHSYPHNLAMQHAAAIHAQKVTSVTHGHGQFSPIPSSGGPVGAIQGVAGGPPGFSGYAMSPSIHSHHPNSSQSASSSLPHIAGQQGVSSSAILTTPRGPPGYHDMRLGGSTWIQR